MAEQLVKAGADVVIGSNAHVLLGGGYLGGAYVDYGLGNLAFYDDTAPETGSGTLILTAQGRHITGAVWRPATILDGVPQPLTGAPATAAVTSWNAARGCTNLSASPSASLTTMRGETVPFVAPPAAPTTTTTTTSSGSSTGREHEHDDGSDSPAGAPGHHDDQLQHHGQQHHDDDTRLDHHVPDRQRGLSASERCAQRWSILGAACSGALEGVLTRYPPVPEPDLLQIVGLGDRLLCQPQHHVGLASQHGPLLRRRRVEHDRSDGVDQADQDGRHARRACRILSKARLTIRAYEGSNSISRTLPDESR